MSTTTGTTRAPRKSKGAKRAVARIMVTEGNGTVASQVRYHHGEVVGTAGRTVTQSIEDLATCDGLLITGGSDVNPALYGVKEHRQTWACASGRDLREVALLSAARDLGVPVLGICRGMQVIAVEAGGALEQHIPDRVKHGGHQGDTMPVHTQRGSLVQRTMGDSPQVVHLHHQAVQRMPKGFIVTAWHEDGTTEAIESLDGRVIGVQFHPEYAPHRPGDQDDTGGRLFAAFVRAAARYRRRTRESGRPQLSRPAQSYVDAHPTARDAYRTRSWDGFGYTAPHKAPKPVVKVTDRRTQVTRDDDAADAVAGWCPQCTIPFDNKQDLTDHIELLHPFGPRPTHSHVTGG